VAEVDVVAWTGALAVEYLVGAERGPQCGNEFVAHRRILGKRADH